MPNRKTPNSNRPHPQPGLRGPRRQPLPASAPKSVDEDPHATERVLEIMASSSYRRADRDIEFLDRDELRPSRLQIEFLKPELAFTETGVHSTIVVFGGTRLVEPAAARRQVEAARQAITRRPGDPELEGELARAERILAKSHYYEIAREFSRLVGHSGEGPLDCRLVVATGGGPGIMEAANRGSYDVGAKSIGLNITLPEEQFPNPYITPDLCFQFRYFALRKMHFMLRARALVAFPGGYGTLDELFEALCLIQTRKVKAMPVVLAGEDYWRQVFNTDFLVAEGAIDPEDAELFWYAETAEEIWNGITRWYEQNGEPLVNCPPE